MRNIFRRTALKRWAPPVALAGLAVAVVLAAPLAIGAPSRGGDRRSPARVRSRTRCPSRSTRRRRATRRRDVHLLAFNDLHGDLDPAGQTMYGQFAGGAAFLAKAVKDNAGAVRRLPGDGLRRRQHRRQPARKRALPRRADPRRHEPDERRLRLGRQPRVRQGQRRAAAHPERRLPSDRRLHAALRTRWRTAARTNTYPGADFQYLSANVVVRRDRQDAVPGLRDQAVQLDRRQAEVQVGFIGEVLQATPTIVTPTGVAGLTFQDEADAANKAVAELARQGREDPGARHPPGRLPDRDAAALERLRRQPRRQRHRRDRQAARPVDQGDRLRPHARRVPLHDHDQRRHAADHQRLVVRPHPQRHHAHDRRASNGKLVAASADNSIVENALNTPRPGRRPRSPTRRKADPAVPGVVNQYVTASAPLANQVIGKIQGDLTRDANAARRDDARRRDRRRAVRRDAAGRPRRRRSSRS